MKQEAGWFNEIETYMMGLLRYGVLDVQPDHLLQSADVDWDKMMDLAAAQGLLAWVWDGICKLPKENQPPRIQSINWGLSAQEIWDGYHVHERVLREIIDICHQNNIKLLLFKGIALSKFYPKPESRPSGDIDFFLFNDYEKGNNIFAKKNVTRTNKRTGFDYKGVHIENHRIFLNTYTKLQVDALSYLETSLKDCSKTEEGYYVMSPTACLVYQVMHLVAHVIDVTNPASMRLIVDVGMTLIYYRDVINVNELEEVLMRLKIDDFFTLVISCAEIILKKDFSCYQFKRIPDDDVKVMFKLLMCLDGDFVPVPERSFWYRVWFYLSNFKSYYSVIKYIPYMRNRFLKKAIEVI